MKIRIITCHDVYNPGASLQAYALQMYISSLGHDVAIIDYKPQYLSGHYSLLAVANPMYNHPIIREMYLVAKLPERLMSLRKKALFDRFRKQKLVLTDRYSNLEELAENPPEADVYIAGSDQIWNTLFNNGRDPAFYLDFAPEGTKRVSYAASFSTNSIVESYQQFVSKMLERLDHVSVREVLSLPLLRELGRTDGVRVCDPVFLLDVMHWHSIVTPVSSKIESDYCLIYDFDRNPLIKRLAGEISKKRSLKIVSVSPYNESYVDYNFSCIGPVEFLSLLAGASFVISNSFHATAFSIMFHKDFIVVGRNENINVRMDSILQDLGLTNRKANCWNENLLANINWDDVEAKLKNIISDSKRFLKDSLS